MCPPLEGLGGSLDYPGSGLVGLSSVKGFTRRQGETTWQQLLEGFKTL